MFMHGQSPTPAVLSTPWRLPPQGLAVFHGERHAPRLSHYFMPRLALEGKRILFLDGANCADPRLMARLAERRGMPFAQFNQQIMMARAFTCFQLTELISRVPQFLDQFPAQVLMITAFPELYFDEDVRPADANAAFQQALGYLRCWGQSEIRNSKFENRDRDAEFRISSFEPQSKIGNRKSTMASPQNPALTVALFSGASVFQPPAGRKLFFAQTCAVATELWKFQVDGQGRLGLLKTGAGDRGSESRKSKIEIRNSRGSTEFRVSNFEFRFCSQHLVPSTPERFAMGRTVATFRDLIEQELQSWKQRFGRALRQEEQVHLEAMFNRVRLYVQACTYHFPVDAMHGIHVAVELDHEIRLRRIEAALGINLETQWMDSRPLPLPAGDGRVADRVEPETPPAD